MTRRRVLLPARVTPLSIAFVCASTCALAQPAAAGTGVLPIPRVRSTTATIASVIEQVSERSATFRRLVETINASDGIVYVEEGACGRGVSACLVTVKVAGPNRLLWVWVDTRKLDAALMGLIGHELRHTIEVLSDPMVTNGHALSNFYQRQGWRSAEGRFETQAAIEAGEAVRAEVLRYRPRPEAR
jgi:hypothetical protein